MSLPFRALLLWTPPEAAGLCKLIPHLCKQGGSLAALIAFLFSLGLKNVQSSLDVSPQQEPRVTPRAGPSLGTGSRGMDGGTPLAHPLLTKAHNELYFKKAGESLRWTRREAENS